MLELVLSRDPDDKLHYVASGVGEARVTGFFKPVITLSTTRGTWTFGGKLGLRSKIDVLDGTGLTAASADLGQRRIDTGGRTFRIEGGTVVAHNQRSEVQLLEGERLLARYEAAQWGLRGGEQMQRMWVDERAATDDGLLVLFASHCAGHWIALDSIGAGLR